MLAILKNRLFPIKPLPLFKPLRSFQFDREVAEEYLWFRNVCNPFNVLIVWYSAVIFFNINFKPSDMLRSLACNFMKVHTLFSFPD